jgi:hypothetical protein
LSLGRRQVPESPDGAHRERELTQMNDPPVDLSSLRT